MNKLETLVVPKQLGTWLEDKELGDRSCYFTVINELEEFALYKISVENNLEIIGSVYENPELLEVEE